MVNLEMRAGLMAQQMKEYLSRDLGAFYIHGADRLMLYPFMAVFFLAECFAFWLLYQGPSFVLNYMAFTTVFSLHKAAAYTICMLGADILAHYLAPSWGAYNNRTIGRQWIIWSLGLAAGFVLQRTIVRSLVVFYSPEVVSYFMTQPQMNLKVAALLLILVPYWIVVVFLTLRIASSKQRIQQQVNKLLVTPGDKVAKGLHSEAGTGDPPSGSLKPDGDNGNEAIALADITHVSVEDHYCHINYSAGNGLKRKMIRLPLKEMLKKLPREHFQQIHRSHVVNIGHISRVAKNGRDYNVVMKRFAVELPVSRSRFKHLQALLKATGVPHN